MAKQLFHKIIKNAANFHFFDRASDCCLTPSKTTFTTTCIPWQEHVTFR